MVDQVGAVQLAPRASLVARPVTFLTGGITLAPGASLVATAYKDVDVLLAASSSLAVSEISFVIGSTPVYYVGEASDSVTIYRYVTEDFDIVTNQRYYVATFGLNGGISLGSAASLTADATTQIGFPTATLSSETRLTALGINPADSIATAALSSQTGLTATGGLLSVVNAVLSAESQLTLTGDVGIAFFFTGGPNLTAVANTITSVTANFTAESFVTATGNVPLILSATANLTSETVLTASIGNITWHGTVDLAANAHLLARALLVPDVVGHSLVYIVTAPNMWDLTSDPDIGPLLQDDTYISVYHTVVNSVDALAGAWRVILLFSPAPFNVNLAASDKCVLIYDVTAISLGEDFEHIVLKNNLGDAADLEIILDGFAEMIMPGMLG